MSASRQAGFTYVAVLILVATLGAIGAAYGELTSHARQREKEKQLLFVGGEYRDAIESYYEKTPGAFKRYPHKLEDLLLDRRFPVAVRHLRRLYPDPMTGGEEWGVVKAPDGGIMGVYSLSGETPVKSGNFSYAERAFEGAASYSAWRFVYEGRSPTGLQAPAPQETGG
jgi:type II secretory pathway pseudopilin PulG